MRLPLNPPAALNTGRAPLHAGMRKGIDENFRGFKAATSDDALIGPGNPWLRWPRLGGPIW